MTLRTIQAGEGGVKAAVARVGLSAMAVAYGLGVRARGAWYSAGLSKPRSLPVPVVSVGNLTAGGTGKTPFVAWLAGKALAAGRHPAILSRGYGPRPAGSALSDEGTLLQSLLEGAVPQVEDPDRARGGARLLLANPDVDLVILDDGFQHRRLARDVDVVLLDATNPMGFRRLLPRGLLREPVAALSRASAVVATRSERVSPDALAALRREASRLAPAALFAVARMVPRALVDSRGAERPARDLKGAAVFAYAGIGNPQAFEGALCDLGCRVVGRWFAADHHAPSPSDVARLAALARAARADRIVVTRKDLVKLSALPSLPDGLEALDISLEVEEGEEALLALALGAGRG